MTKEEILIALKQSDCDLRSYSGRGMYGKQCLGIETDNPLQLLIDMISFLVDYLEAEHEEEQSGIEDLRDVLEDHLRNPRMDNMGRGYIVYWPDFPYDEES